LFKRLLQEKAKQTERPYVEAEKFIIKAVSVQVHKNRGKILQAGPKDCAKRYQGISGEGR